MRSTVVLIISVGLALACGGGGGQKDSGIVADLGNFRWVGLCTSKDACEAFNGSKMDPFQFNELMEEPPGHRLLLEAEGPGKIEVILDLGPMTCGCDDECELPTPNDRKVREFTFDLKEGRNLIDVQKKIHKWERADLQATALYNGEEQIVTAANWALCL